MNPFDSFDLHQLPPQNIEAEESILGGILLDPQAMGRVAALLQPEAFYISAHQKIYACALELYRRNHPTDLMTVTTWLSDRGLLEKVGGTSKLAQLVEGTVSAVNIDLYAALVADKALRRQLIGASYEIAELGHDTSQELESVLNQSEQKVFEVSQGQFGSNTEPNSEIAAAAYDQLEQHLPIYPTGLYDLDELMVGFEPGTLTLIAGRPSMGKSYIALFFAFQMMLLHQLPVIFFSLEMTKKQLEYRLWSLISVTNPSKLSYLSPISGDRIRKHRAGFQPLTNSELATLAKILGVAVELPLYMAEIEGSCDEVQPQKICYFLYNFSL